MHWRPEKASKEGKTKEILHDFAFLSIKMHSADSFLRILPVSPVLLHDFFLSPFCDPETVTSAPCGQEAPASKNGAPVADVEMPKAEDGIASDSAQ